jgi:hypothetical protein
VKRVEGFLAFEATEFPGRTVPEFLLPTKHLLEG